MNGEVRKIKKTIIQVQYDFICEVSRLEKMFPNYNEIIFKLTRGLRNKVLPKADEKMLAMVLYFITNVTEMFVSVFGDKLDFLDYYVRFLVKYWGRYSSRNYENEYESVQCLICVVKENDIIENRWNEINPYYSKQYSDEDLYGKNLLDILQEFVNHVDENSSKEFFVKEKNLKRLVRARNGKRKSGSEIVPPPVEVAKKLNIINRWNPPDKRYLYLAEELDGSDSYEVCLEEKRANKGEGFTFVDFKVQHQAREKRLLNLAYEGVKDSDIEKDINKISDSIAEEGIELLKREIKTDGLEGLGEKIDSYLGQKRNEIYSLANLYTGRKLLSALCRVIFVPLDNDEDNDPELKDRCYKSFHVLAEFLEKNGFAGVIFPSTRMMLLGKRGVNVVLFNPEDAYPVEETLKYVIKK